MSTEHTQDPKGFIEKGFVFLDNNQPVMVVGFLSDSDGIVVKTMNMNSKLITTMDYEKVATIQKKWQTENPNFWTM
jgi:hypothetical protein